jgi:hypothetical protein
VPPPAGPGIDLSRYEIMVRGGKGGKDRVTMLPESLWKPLQEQLQKDKSIHEKDLADAWGRVSLTEALDRKYPNAPTKLGRRSGSRQRCF